MLKQSQQQRLLQKLSPQQIQLMKLLQIPTANLEERVKEEIEENPALEYELASNEDEDNFDSAETETDDFENEEKEVDLIEDTTEKVDLESFLKQEYEEREGNDYSDDYYAEKGQQVFPASIETSLHDHLSDQLGMLELDERSEKIAEQIIGSIDEDGYLRREPSSIADDLAFGQNIDTTTDEISDLILNIQQFDPPGVCAWTLQDCLLLQLKRLPETEAVHNAIQIIDKHFNEFIKKHYDKVQRHLDLNDEDFKKVINIIIKLNPKPGAAFSFVSKAQNYVIPDFFVFNNNGIPELSLNAKKCS